MASKYHEQQFDLESVRSVIVESLPAGQPTLDHTAQTLEISPRTLQRRLAEMGLSYTQLVDEVRFIKARQLIIEQTKLSDIASSLGYADAGSFTRAFERWTGMPPQQYRKQFYKSSKPTQSRPHR